MGGRRGAARPDPRCPRCPLTRTRSGLFPLTFASVVGRRLAAACVLFRRSSRTNVKGVGSGRGAGRRVPGSRQSYRDRPGSDGALEHQPFARDWTGNSIVASPLPLSWEDWPGGSSSTLRCPADRGGQRDLSGGRGGRALLPDAVLCVARSKGLPPDFFEFLSGDGAPARDEGRAPWVQTPSGVRRRNFFSAKYLEVL